MTMISRTAPITLPQTSLHSEIVLAFTDTWAKILFTLRTVLRKHFFLPPSFNSDVAIDCTQRHATWAASTRPHYITMAMRAPPHPHPDLEDRPPPRGAIRSLCNRHCLSALALERRSAGSHQPSCTGGELHVQAVQARAGGPLHLPAVGPCGDAGQHQLQQFAVVVENVDHRQWATSSTTSANCCSAGRSHGGAATGQDWDEFARG